MKDSILYSIYLHIALYEKFYIVHRDLAHYCLLLDHDSFLKQ